MAARYMNAGPFAHFEHKGTILFNGRPHSRRNNDLVSYVEQEDEYHLPALTVSCRSLLHTELSVCQGS